MKTLKNWTLAINSLPTTLNCWSMASISCSLYVLEENLFRVLLKRKGELALDRTRSIARRRMPWKAAAAKIQRLLACPRTLIQHDDIRGYRHRVTARNRSPAAVAGVALSQQRRRMAAVGE